MPKKKIKQEASEDLNLFRSRKVGDRYLLTNEWGEYIFLTPKDFDAFKQGKVPEDSLLHKELSDLGFLRSNFNAKAAIERYRDRYQSIFNGASLHIIVVTLRCNYKCVYCHASSLPMAEENTDMDLKTAEKTVDFIFTTPNPRITIEFQGGEPLVNWKTVKHIVEYAEEKNKKAKKQLYFGLVTNMSLMDEAKLRFLMKHKVGLCTSLDGPEFIHNHNRPYPQGNSYKEATKWIKKIRKIEKIEEKKGKPIYLLSASLTVSREALKYPKEIVDEYKKWGFRGVALRPLNYFGAAGRVKDKIGYSAEEFMVFWKKAMDYIIALNLKGEMFIERNAKTIFEKVLLGQDTGYMDLKSPCGAAIGQITYNYDGKIFTCDEARMCKEDTFMLGDLTKKEMDYKKLISSNDKVKTVITASTLDSFSCDYCVYKPYCGICPVVNFNVSGNLFPAIQTTDWCKRHMAMFDYLFKKMQNRKIADIFSRWAELGYR